MDADHKSTDTGRSNPEGKRMESPFAKKVITSVVGFTVLLIGVIMIVTPGPAIIVIPAGLTILASEYSWARRWLNKIKKLGMKTAEAAPTPKWIEKFKKALRH